MSTKFDEFKAKMARAGIGIAKPSEPTQFLDTGFAPLNKAISGRLDGGLPVGRIVEVYGPPSSGKTAIATRAMAAAQQMGGFAIFQDHERAYAERQAARLGVNLAENYIYNQPRTLEESFEQFQMTCKTIREDKMIAPEAPICTVFDSIAAMIPQQMLKDFSAMNMNDMTALARVMSLNLKIVAVLAAEYNACAVFNNQIRLKPGVVYGDPTTTPGGNAMDFYASVRIALGASRLQRGKGEEVEIIGQQVTARCVKNKINRPFLKAKWQFRFREDGSGFFDAENSLIDFLVERRILEKNPSGFITWTDGKKFYQDKLAEKIRSEGLTAELAALLPADAEVEVDEEAAAAVAAREAAENEALSAAVS